MNDCFSVDPLYYSHPRSGPSPSTCLMVGLAVLAFYFYMTPPRQAYYYAQRPAIAAMISGVGSELSNVFMGGGIISAGDKVHDLKGNHKHKMVTSESPSDDTKHANTKHTKAWMAAHPNCVVFVFAFWCPHCHSMMPEFKEHGDCDVLFVDSDALSSAAWSGPEAIVELSAVPTILTVINGEKQQVGSPAEAANAIKQSKATKTSAKMQTFNDPDEPENVNYEDLFRTDSE